MVIFLIDDLKDDRFVFFSREIPSSWPYEAEGGAVKKAGKSRSHRLHGLVEKNHGYKIKTKCGIIYQENEYLKVNFFETKVNFKKVKNAPTYNRREMLSSI